MVKRFFSGEYGWSSDFDKAKKTILYKKKNILGVFWWQV